MTCSFCGRAGHNIRSCNSPVVVRLCQRVNDMIMDLKNQYLHHPSFPAIMHARLAHLTLPEIKVVFTKFVGTLCNFSFRSLNIDFQLNKNELLKSIIEEIIHQIRTPLRIAEIRTHEERYGNQRSRYIPQLPSSPTLNFHSHAATAAPAVNPITPIPRPVVRPIRIGTLANAAATTAAATNPSDTAFGPYQALSIAQRERILRPNTSSISDEDFMRYVEYYYMYHQLFNVPLPDEIINALVFFESIFQRRYPLFMFRNDIQFVLQDSALQNIDRNIISRTFAESGFYANYIIETFRVPNNQIPAATATTTTPAATPIAIRRVATGQRHTVGLRRSPLAPQLAPRPRTPILPSVKKITGSLEYDGECPICYDKMTNYSKKVKTSCEHYFCNTCFDNHISYQTNQMIRPNCPMCRTNISEVVAN